MKAEEFVTEEEMPSVRTPTVKQVAQKHSVSPQIILTQLQQGIEVELEHTTNRKAAREIALDHLSEYSDYYTRLAKMER